MTTPKIRLEGSESLAERQAMQADVLTRFDQVIADLEGLCAFVPPSSALQLRERGDPNFMQRQVGELKAARRTLALKFAMVDLQNGDRPESGVSLAES